MRLLPKVHLKLDLDVCASDEIRSKKSRCCFFPIFAFLSEINVDMRLLPKVHLKLDLDL